MAELFVRREGILAPMMRFAKSFVLKRSPSLRQSPSLQFDDAVAAGGVDAVAESSIGRHIATPIPP